MKDSTWSIVQGTMLGLAIGALALVASRETHAERGRDKLKVELAERETQIHKTCVAGAGLLAVVEHRLEHGDEGAEEMAKDVLAYGLPWLDLCTERQVDPMPGSDLLTEIQAIRADLDQRYGAGEKKVSNR